MDLTLQKHLFDEINGYIDANSTKLASEEMSHLASTYYDADYSRARAGNDAAAALDRRPFQHLGAAR